MSPRAVSLTMRMFKGRSVVGQPVWVPAADEASAAGQGVTSLPKRLSRAGCVAKHRVCP